jgi:tetratricopeptide (TPR) repeat protein
LERKSFFMNTAVPGEKNAGSVKFANASSASGWDLTDDGRGLALVDWDFDGDVDFWMSNRTGPRLRLIRNELNRGGSSVTFFLKGTQVNRDAIGARIIVEVGGKKPYTLQRSLRAGEGFMSQSSKQVPFGLGRSTEIKSVKVRWPGGKEESFSGAKVGKFYQLTEGQGKAEEWLPPKNRVPLTPGALPALPRPSTARIVSLSRPTLPTLNYQTAQGEAKKWTAESLTAPLIVNLWSATCDDCTTELAEWAQQREALKKAGFDLLILNADPAVPEKNLPELAADRHHLSAETLQALECFGRTLTPRVKPVAAPTTYLLDRTGRVVVTYQGKVASEQLIADAALLTLPENQWLSSALVAPGRWLTALSNPNLILYANTLVDDGLNHLAIDYLHTMIQKLEREKPAHGHKLVSQMHGTLAQIYSSRAEQPSVEKSLLLATQTDPENVSAWQDLGLIQLNKKDYPGAEASLMKSLTLAPPAASTLHSLVQVKFTLRKYADVIPIARQALTMDAAQVQTRHHLAMAHQALGQDREAVDEYWRLLKQEKNVLAANSLSWLLSSSTQDSVRNPALSWEIAQDLVQTNGSKEPVFLITAGAAAAANNRFDEAQKIATQALTLIKQNTPKSQLIPLLERQLKAYAAGQPNREPLFK